MHVLHPGAASRSLRRAFLAVVVPVMAACGGGGDGGTEVQGPVITSVSPSTVVMYEPDFILTVNGSGFVPESLVQWDGSDRNTTFVSETELTALIPATDVEEGMAAQVSVFDRRANIQSNVRTVMFASPAPMVTALSPERVLTGGGPVLLRVLGDGFTDRSRVQRDGASRLTTFVSRNELVTEIPPTEMASGRVIVVAVTTGGPGGGTSGNFYLPVSAPPYPIPVPTALSPAVLLAGVGGTVTVTGTGFTPFTRVDVIGVFPRPAVTVVSSTQLRFTLTPDNMPPVGSWQVTLTNPEPGGGAGPPIALRVENPAPVITALSPAQAVVGQQSQVVRITGTGFVLGTFILFNGEGKGGGYLSSTELQLILRPGDLDQAGTFPITVSNSSPGGGVSNALPFTVVNPPAN
ncbi:MAG TPA: IPT/TIG domain-containing protein [Longimicrobium sp.]|nr:IPT/TIG domain-containing protein [Longimicrobium sp.]